VFFVIVVAAAEAAWDWESSFDARNRNRSNVERVNLG